MIQQILLGLVLVLATTLMHGMGTLILLVSLRRIRRGHWQPRGRGSEWMLVTGVVLLLFLLGLLEAFLWAITYLAAGAIRSLEEALYFSIVTFTTLGYGDVTLDASWRIFASLQAATGILVFGWTTALIVALLHHLIARREHGGPD